MNILDEFKLTEIEYTEKDTKIKVSKIKYINNPTNPSFQNQQLFKENPKKNKASLVLKLLLQLLVQLIMLQNQVLKNLLK